MTGSEKQIEWNEIIEKIKEAANENFFSEYGIKIDDKKYEIDETVDVSREWEDDKPTGKMLDGTSCLSICKYEEIDNLTEQMVENVLKQANKYYGKYTYLIGGELEEYGNDPNEVVLKDSKIITTIAIN